MQECYKSGEHPQFGDLVTGIPNNARKSIAGIVTTAHEGLIRVAFFKPGGDDAQIMSIYGESSNFNLLARDTEG